MNYVIKYAVTVSSRDYYGEYDLNDELFDKLEDARSYLIKEITREGLKFNTFGRMHVFRYIKVMKVNSNPKYKTSYPDYVGYVRKLYKLDKTGKLYCTRNIKSALWDFEDLFRIKLPRKLKKARKKSRNRFDKVISFEEID